MSRRAPRQKPGQSEQAVATPPDLLEAVRKRFGHIDWDLAATRENSVAAGSYFGPGSEFAEDALFAEWPRRPEMLCWLNPPYAHIGPWAAKAVLESEQGCQLLMLVPAAVGADWFNRWVRPYAYVLELSPRVTFVNHAHAYPKDLIIAHYSPHRLIGRRAWEWKPPRKKRRPS